MIILDDVVGGILDFMADLASSILSFFIDFIVGLITNITGIFGSYLSTWMVEQGFTLEIPDEVFNVLDEITIGIGYIFPLYAFIPIVTFMLGFYLAKLAISLFTGLTKSIKLGGV